MTTSPQGKYSTAPGSRAYALIARVNGILIAPRATFEALSAAPRAFGVITLTLFVTLGCSAIVLETNVGQLALLDRWDRLASVLGQAVDDGQYQAMAEASRHGAAYAAFVAVLTGPLLTAGLSVLLFAAFRAPAASAVTYLQVLAVVGHAGVVLALRQVVAAPLTYVRETLSSPLTMGAFFPMLDAASPGAHFFASVDLFVIWWIVVLAIGMSVLYRTPARRVAFVFVGVYVTLSFAMAMVATALGGTA